MSEQTTTTRLDYILEQMDLHLSDRASVHFLLVNPIGWARMVWNISSERYHWWRRYREHRERLNRIIREINARHSLRKAVPDAH